VILLGAVSCIIGSGNIGGGMGTLTISLGNSGRAAANDQPAIPDFSKITIRVKNAQSAVIDTTEIAEGGACTISLPSGAEYTVEADAEVGDSPTTFGLRYAGSATVTVEEDRDTPVSIALSVTETMLVAKDPEGIKVFSSFNTIVPGPYKSISWNNFVGFFFDRYGRLFMVDKDGATVMSSDKDNQETLGSLGGLGASETFTSVAYYPQTDRLYLGVNLSTAPGSLDPRIAGVSLSRHLANTSSSKTGISEEAGITPPVNADPNLSGFHVAAGEDSLYLGCKDRNGRDYVIAKYSPPYGTETAAASVICGTLHEMKVINGRLYVLGSNPGEIKLFVFDTSRLTPVKELSIPNPTTDPIALANIAGWGKNSVYVYYLTTAASRIYLDVDPETWDCLSIEVFGPSASFGP
jgi:hypothetical protein